MSNVIELKKELLLFNVVQAIREFFAKEGFLDVLTPIMVSNPGMETHIHPFCVKSVNGVDNGSGEIKGYLHTSPEFYMKKLLSDSLVHKISELEKIFTINYCFRDENFSPIHRNQFLMLEWYRTYDPYEKIMEDVIQLIRFVHFYLQNKKLSKSFSHDFQKLECKKITVQEAFFKYANVDILNYLDVDSIIKLIESKFSEISLPLDKSKMLWDDYYHLIYLDYIEPQLLKDPFVLLYEFPAPLSALSTLKVSDNRVCERFEVYINGVELCNCFNEITDLVQLKKRFCVQKDDKKKIYGYSLPEPKVLYDAMERGLPKSSGVALGVERLLMGLIGEHDLFIE